MQGDLARHVGPFLCFDMPLCRVQGQVTHIAMLIFLYRTLREHNFSERIRRYVAWGHLGFTVAGKYSHIKH